MKNKLIEAIRNKFKNLGLGEKVIEAAAATLEASVKEESEIEAAVAGIEPFLKAIQGETDRARGEKSTAEKRVAELEAQVKALGAAPDKKPEPANGDDVDAKIAAKLAELVKPLQDKVDAYEAKETASARATLITNKAKELGIDDWRIKQGFNIADDADETAITATLASIKQDIVTAGLGSQTGFPIATSADQAKARATTWAEGLPDKKV